MTSAPTRTMPEGERRKARTTPVTFKTGGGFVIAATVLTAWVPFASRNRGGSHVRSIFDHYGMRGVLIAWASLALFYVSLMVLAWFLERPARRSEG